MVSAVSSSHYKLYFFQLCSHSCIMTYTLDGINIFALPKENIMAKEKVTTSRF